MSANPPAQVSVILPAFNRLRFLRLAVDSVFAQTSSDWELVVADDGSDAPTREYLAGLADQRVRVLWLAHCGSPSRVRNAALAAARGRFVAFLDSDDVWAPTFLEQSLRALASQSRYRWSYCACDRVDTEGRRIVERPSAARIPRSGWIFDALLARRLTIAMPAVVAERALVTEAGDFDEQQNFGEFLDLFLRLARRSPAAAVADSLCSIRKHDEHYSADRRAAFESWMRLYAKHAGEVKHARQRSLCERMRALAALDLARTQRAAGQRTAALHTLRSARVFSWRNASLWGRALYQLTRPMP